MMKNESSFWGLYCLFEKSEREGKMRDLRERERIIYEAGRERAKFKRLPSGWNVRKRMLRRSK